MKPSQILKDMKELREAWRKQGFSFNRDQIEELIGAGFSAYYGDIRQ